VHMGAAEGVRNWSRDKKKIMGREGKRKERKQNIYKETAGEKRDVWGEIEEGMQRVKDDGLILRRR